MNQNRDTDTSISELIRTAESCVGAEARCTSVVSMSKHAAYAITGGERAYMPY